MKINEIMQPSIKSKASILKESWSNDSEQPFSESQLQVIAEDVIRAESNDNWKYEFNSVDSMMKFLRERAK